MLMWKQLLICGSELTNSTMLAGYLMWFDDVHKFVVEIICLNIFIAKGESGLNLM